MITGVGQVHYNQDWVEAVEQHGSLYRSWPPCRRRHSFGRCVTIIANTIRFTLFARREEIDILRHDRSHHSFIRIPYLLEGAVLGFLGSALSLVILKFGFELFRQKSGLPVAFSGGRPADHFFPWRCVVLFGGGGLFLGFAGSYLSLLRFGEGRA